jgi:hypothetical protein
MALPNVGRRPLTALAAGSFCFDRPQPLWQWRAAIRDENADNPTPR